MDGRPIRLRVVSGEHIGRRGHCLERHRVVSGEYGPGKMLPIDLDDGHHLHLRFEDVEFEAEPHRARRPSVVPVIIYVAFVLLGLGLIGRQTYLRATLGPVTSSHLVVGGIIYHYAGWGKWAQYRDAEVVSVNGNQVVLREWTWLGGMLSYHSRSELLDGHREAWSIYREWAAHDPR
jgi:hypothetical protein